VDPKKVLRAAKIKENEAYGWRVLRNPFVDPHHEREIRLDDTQLAIINYMCDGPYLKEKGPGYLRALEKEFGDVLENYQEAIDVAVAQQDVRTAVKAEKQLLGVYKRFAKIYSYGKPWYFEDEIRQLQSELKNAKTIADMYELRRNKIDHRKAVRKAFENAQIGAKRLEEERRGQKKKGSGHIDNSIEETSGAIAVFPK
jgi:hypothetical protein